MTPGRITTRRAHQRLDPRTGKLVTVTEHNVRTGASNPAAQIAGLTDVQHQAELEASVAYWSQVADRDHPNVQALRREVANNARPAPGELYRGFATIPPFPKISELVEGADLRLPFVSCSTDPAVAEEFSWDDNLDEEDPTIAPVIIELLDAHGVDIASWSHFPDQEEWIVEGTAIIEHVEANDEGFGAPSLRVTARYQRTD